MQVGRIFGIRILLDKFFLLLLLLYGVFGLLPQVLTVFAVVFIHEMAHILVAYSYGYRVKEIELLPFGGVARIEDFDLIALNPVAETNIALAGPLQNFLLAGLALFLRHFVIWQEPLANFFLYSNLAMAGLNLLPVLPLDGGRVYRAFLVNRLGYRQATEKVAVCGRVVGVILALVSLVGLYGGWFNITVFFIALFIFLAAGRERTAAIYIFMRFMTRKKEELRERGILPVEALVATENTTLRELVRRFVPKRYYLVLVLDADHYILGFLTEAEIVQVLFEQGLDTTLRTVLQNRSGKK
ncbi:MAG: site-2 protease family protein [bacterium]|jgi:stage IV sporulation protein FB